MNRYDVTIIGGGPAGLAAAIEAYKQGSKVLLIEREARLGGVLKQCIHDGFGLLRFKEKLSGSEYATRFIHELATTNVEVKLQTFASKIINKVSSFELILITSLGMEKIHSNKIIFATGCRERTSRQIAIHGTRPAGVLTAGTAQYYINVLGKLPGKNCIILGSGDIGLIMARRLTLEGANVLGVYEAKSEPSGLMRNVYQCLEDFDIPLHLSETVTEVHGRDRLEGVTLVKLDENMKEIVGTHRFVPCDTLILSVGLIPENELPETLSVAMDPLTKGPLCDQNYMTSVPGIFSCGNSLHVNDLVDFVSESGESAARAAVAYNYENTTTIKVDLSQDFLYTIPKQLNINTLNDKDKVDFFFRSKATRENVVVSLLLDNKVIFSKKYATIRPPEMEKISLSLPALSQSSKLKLTMEVL